MRSVSNWLSRAPSWVLVAWALTAAFGTYFCMYAFRKPFTVGTYGDEVGALGLSAKALFILAQALGYCISKFLGISVVSEIAPARRAWAIGGIIAVAELGLVAFGLLPAPWSALAMIVNGLPLGMVWGLVFGFLEGRRVSDVLGVGLCVSFILASGVVKSAGKLVLGEGVAEAWMPAVTGACFIPAMALFVGMLAVLPPPDAADIAARTKRVPMDGAARAAFVRSQGPGLLALLVFYVGLTAYRDIRDNFAAELWTALGYGSAPSIFATAEVPVALGALVAVLLTMAVRENRQALRVIHGVMALGVAMIGIATLAFQLGLLGPVPWMITVGLGLYLGYVPFNCVLFDRLIAALGVPATAGFLITAADAWGYLGSAGVLVYKNFGDPTLPWLTFFCSLGYAVSVGGVALCALSAAYFWQVGHGRTAPAQ